MNHIRSMVGCMTVKVPSRTLHIGTSRTPVVEVVRSFSTDVTRTSLRYERAPKGQQHHSDSNGNNNNNNNNNNNTNNTRPIINYTSKRTISNPSADLPPTHRYRSNRTKETVNNNRNCNLLMNRLRQGEIFGEADRETLLKFAKTKQGAREFASVYASNYVMDGTSGADIVATFIHLLQGSVAELACDTDFGPFIVLNSLSLKNRAGINTSDRRLRDVIIGELFMSKQNMLDSALTKHGQLIFRHILQDGTTEERDFLLDVLKENMMELALHEHGHFVVVHARECLPAEQWKPLSDELVASNENIMRLASAPKGAFVLQALLESEFASYESKARVAATFKENVHNLLEHNARGSMYSLSIVLRCLPKLLHDELATELLSRPETIAAYACNAYGGTIIVEFIQYGSMSERKAVCDGLRGRMVDLSTNEFAQYVLPQAQEFLPTELVKPLVDELVASNENIMRLACAHQGAFVLKSLLENEDSPYEYKVRIADAWKENVHTSFEQDAKSFMFCLKLVLKSLPEVLRGEVVAELVSRPDTVAMYASNAFGLAIVKDFVENGTMSEQKAVCDGIRGRIADLSTDEYGNLLLTHAHQFLPTDLWKPLGDELVSSDDNILRLARCHQGTFVLRALLNDGSSPYEYKARIAETFKENVHNLLEHNTRESVFSLNIILTCLPKNLRDELGAELLSRPETIAMYACNAFSFKTILDFINYGTPSEQRALCDGMRGRMMDLSIDEHGNYVVLRAQEFLSTALWRPLGDELVASSENVMRLACSHKGAFVLKDILRNEDSPIHYKARIVDAFKEKVNFFWDQGDKAATFSLKLVLQNLPQELRADLIAKLLNIPAPKLVQCALHVKTAKVFTLMVESSSSDQLKMVTKAFEKNVPVLKSHQRGREVVMALMRRLEADDVKKPIALSAELRSIGLLKRGPPAAANQQETRKIVGYRPRK